jgi:hypothetical protein
MRLSEIVSESDIVDLNKRREQERLKSFHQDFRAQIKNSSSEMLDAYQEAKSKGWFDDLPMGTRFTLPKGESYIVTGHTMTGSKTDQLQRHQLEFRHKHNFGPPVFIESENRFYRPMINARQVSGEEADATMSFELDKLVNFETGEKRYKKFTGPTKVESQVRNKHKKIKGQFATTTKKTESEHYDDEEFFYEEELEPVVHSLFKKMYPEAEVEMEMYGDGYLSIRTTDEEFNFSIGISNVEGENIVSVGNAYAGKYRGIVGRLVQAGVKILKKHHPDAETYLNVQHDVSNNYWLPLANKLGIQYDNLDWNKNIDTR